MRTVAFNSGAFKALYLKWIPYCYPFRSKVDKFFSVKDQMVHTSVFADHTISVVTTENLATVAQKQS